MPASTRVKKYCLKKKTEAKFTHVTAVEADDMQKMHDGGLSIKKIAKLLSRSTDTVSKHVKEDEDDDEDSEDRNPVGRPRSVTPEIYKEMAKKYAVLLANARGKKEVTINMVKISLKLKISTKVMLEAFHEK